MTAKHCRSTIALTFESTEMSKIILSTAPVISGRNRGKETGVSKKNNNGIVSLSHVFQTHDDLTEVMTVGIAASQ